MTDTWTCPACGKELPAGCDGNCRKGVAGMKK